MKDFRLLLIVFLLFGGLFQAVGQSVPSYVPTNGLVGWWPFNGNAQDASGNGNHGTVNGATLTSDRLGNQNSSYLFGSSGSSNISTTISQLNVDYSFSIWLRTSHSFQDEIGIIAARNTASIYTALFMNANTSIGQYHFNCSNLDHTNGGSGLMNDGNWQHIVCVKSGSVMKIYINSNNVATNTISINTCLQGFIKFGIDDYRPATRYFVGNLDDIGIWNRALTQQEINLLYQTCQLSLTTQPSNQTIGANRNAHFSVVSSEPNSTFRWQTNLGFGFQDLQNAGQYTGAQTSTLTVSNTSPQNDNQLFRCIVSTTHCGIDTSDVATLNVNSSSNSNSVPNKFNYQLVVRDTTGQLVSNRPVSMRLSLQRGPQMSNLYTETHQLTTNSSGLLTTTIGSGVPTHSSMDSLDWSLGQVFVKTEIDMNGGSNYSLVNTRELLSVPYALYSLNSGNSTQGPVGPMGPQGPAGATGPQGPQGAMGQNAGPVFITPTSLFHKYGGMSNSSLDTIIVTDFDSILNLHPSSVIIQYQYVGNYYTGSTTIFCKIDAATSGRIYNFCDIQNSIMGPNYTLIGGQITNDQVILPVSPNGLVNFDFYTLGMSEIKLDLLGYFP
jgi:hypothetical protein